MNQYTRIFLVLLRLAIGWHFLAEGWEKIHSHQVGKTETKRPFTSEGYLREATGPLAGFFRNQAGDPDVVAQARLILVPLQADQDPRRTAPHTQFPPALAQEWQAYFDAFTVHYQLEKQQQTDAQAKILQRQDQTVNWLKGDSAQGGVKKVRKIFPTGTVEVEMTTPQRLDEYLHALKETKEIETKAMPAFKRDVWKETLRKKKAEVAKLRNDLLRDLDDQTEEMKAALALVLTPEQVQLGPVLPPETMRPIERIDLITSYGLAVVGACLLLGLFSRTACVAGAMFLLLLFLSMPPFPWLPEPARVEGHYLFVNKNLIEMLALLALATTHSGRWAGLDGLVQFLNPRRWRERPPVYDKQGGRRAASSPVLR